MNSIFLILASFWLFVVALQANGREIVEKSTPRKLFAAEPRNDYPIIGILALDYSYSLVAKFPHASYIASSYVKFVEGGGARVVPVWIDKPREYYEGMMSKLNGMLFVGGAVLFNESGYAKAGRYIYDIAKEMNDNGNYFPLWGTCLGFELLTYLSANGDEHRADCKSNNQALPLEFKEDFQSSRMFTNAPESIINILKNESVTANFHSFCVTEKNLTDFHIDNEWRVISVNRDLNGLEFISSVEHWDYPFYGIQFHPEKNLYEWVRNKNISHSQNAIKSAQYFAQFFVNEARKSTNNFTDPQTENRFVIYNFNATFTGAANSGFEQCYMFPSDIDYPQPQTVQTASGISNRDTADNDDDFEEF